MSFVPLTAQSTFRHNEYGIAEPAAGREKQIFLRELDVVLLRWSLSMCVDTDSAWVPATTIAHCVVVSIASARGDDHVSSASPSPPSRST
jgi:hypothetical protein